ncbi:MAG: hypothetical protein LUG60_10765 [Erysipelotrichaceae bacterium]|nr:hypothetical protein [Erysipelotrichaceae bacterium]
MKYKVVYLKDDYLDLLNYYPHFIEWIYTTPIDTYTSKQIELLFEPIQEGKKYLLKILEKREDYQYYHGVHILHNLLTDEIIHIKMNEYDIEVKENDEKHDIFDILKQFSCNFYMIFDN